MAKWRPQRNALGQVVAGTAVRLVAPPADGPGDEAVIPVLGTLLSRARPGDRVELVDARARHRVLKVLGRDGAVVVCEGDSTAYVVTGTALTLRRGKRIVGRGEVAEPPPAPQSILLRPGDTLVVFCGDAPGRDAVIGEDDRIVEPACIGCALLEVFLCVRAGERIYFDDGRIAGVIRHVTAQRMRVEITNAIGGAAKLRGEKGINLPDTDLRLPALTAKDGEDLAYVARHADRVALSFVQRPEDSESLVARLEALGASHLGIVLKIETRQAFRNLPALLLAAMRHPPVAVMLARGDPGVEVGFERPSEVQEEILWICEAARVPVIWATQVLESLAKGGMPSRAEVTDAAMGSRAECVMLNKGPYITQTRKFLRDVVDRMATHQEKKTAMLRKLSISDFGPAGGSDAPRDGGAR